MSESTEALEAPLAPAQLAARWQVLCADPTFEDVAGKIELTCSDAYLSAHPEEMPLTAAPELCVGVVSATNALPKLREKAVAYINAGAKEAWLVFPDSRRIEIYGRDGQSTTSTFAVDIASLLA